MLLIDVISIGRRRVGEKDYLNSLCFFISIGRRRGGKRCSALMFV